MAEAYGGGIMGRFEQFFDAIPGGMRGSQAPIVRMAIGGALGYAAVMATAPMNSAMFFDDGTPKPWSLSQEGVNAGKAASTPVPYWLVPVVLGVAAGTII
jgi:hypothetical protein